MALGELKNGIGPDAYAIYQQVLAAVVERDHPVGSLYISENATSPAELYGGTWERIKDSFILAAGDTYAAGSTGGEEKHILTERELPSLRGSIISHSDGAKGLASTWYTANGVFKNSTKWSGHVKPQTAMYKDAGSIKAVLFEAGNDQPHNNMPPYTTKYVWQRIE